MMPTFHIVFRSIVPVKQQHQLSVGSKHQMSLSPNADVNHIEFRRYVTLIQIEF